MRIVVEFLIALAIMVATIIIGACVGACAAEIWHRWRLWRAPPFSAEAIAAAFGGVSHEPEREDRPVETRTGDEPIRAWKRAHALVLPNGQVSFRPMMDGHPSYGVVAEAKCAHRHGGDHRVPDLGCTCGFYALSEPMEPSHELAVLEVELYGRVIVCENGYRAEKQRVMSVTAVPRCSMYDWPQPGGSLSAGVLTAHTTSAYPSPCRRTARYVNSQGTALCAWHAMEGRSRFYEWTPEPVACETEWRWVQ